MKNSSKHSIVRIEKDACRTRGSWKHWCEWLEIYGPEGDLLAVVDEEHGQIELPSNPGGWKDRSCGNRCIPVTLLEIKNWGLIVQVHNKFGTVKKLYFHEKREQANQKKIVSTKAEPVDTSTLPEWMQR